MTITYDPTDATYRDEADVRNELARVHDVCNGCRRCVDLCPSFSTLFDLLDRHDEPDASLLTPAQQDEMVDACFQCSECRTICPYTPDRDAARVDVPALMLRAKSVQFDNKLVGTRSRPSPRFLGRADRVGRVATRFPTFAKRLSTAPAGSRRRRLLRRVTGLSARRRLPEYAERRFSTWFSTRPVVHMRRPQAEVSVFPTCLVEYQATDIGRDLVKVYERNGIECTLSDARCCGAALLHAGDVDGFATVAEKNVRAFSAEIADGKEIVVGQPTCAHVIRESYPSAVGESTRDDAREVARHTWDAADFLMRSHREDDYVLDTEFAGEIPRTIAYHASGHLRAVEDGLAGRDLLKLAGARVRLVQRSTGTEGIWDLRADHDDVAAVMSERVATAVEAADRDAVVGDCHLSNLAIAEHSGREVVHPLQMLARAYGIPEST